MNKYFYEARNAYSGELIKGYVMAQTKMEVIDYLKREQYLIIGIHHNDIYCLKEYLKILSKRKNIKLSKIILLCQQLAVMLEAGIDILTAFKLVNAHMNDKVMNEFIMKTLQGLNTGNSLAKIWQDEYVLPRYLINSINVAEHTGLLAVALKDAGGFLAKKQEYKRKIQQICIYPIFLLSVLCIIISLMIFLVIPAFAEVFNRMNIDLPWLTQFIISIGLVLKNNFKILILFLCILVLGGYKLWCIHKFRLIILQKLIKMPIVGKILIKLYLLDMSHQLVFLLANGISIDEGIEILIEDEQNNLLVRDTLQKVAKLINQGYSLAIAFSKVPLNDNIFQEFVNIGEQTGMLVNMLEYLVSFWEKEVDNLTKIITQLLEPILMVCVGVIVGIFVISIIMPLLELVGNIGI